MTTLNWRPHTEVPEQKGEELEACLIAEQNCDGDWFLAEGLFYHQSFKGEPLFWLSENNWGEYKPDAIFFWLPESELLATLPEVKK